MSPQSYQEFLEEMKSMNDSVSKQWVREEKHRWKPMEKDCLPAREKRVLLSDGESVEIGGIYRHHPQKDDINFILDDIHGEMNPTHWMELPDLPEK